MRTLRNANSLAMLALLAMISTMLLPLFSVSAMAQATTGSIRGTVTDQSSAVIDKVSVSAKNQATGVQSPIFQTTGEGLYVVPNLTPGKYTLIVEQKGFKRGEYTDVEVRLGQESVVDVLLQPGGINDVISVTATNQILLGRDTSQVSSSIDARRVQDLPANIAGGGLDVLALLVPGVTPGYGNVGSSGTTLSVNGSRARSVSFNIDGQDNNGQEIGGLLFGIDNPDLVADYQVITNNFSSQYGRNAGAIVNIITRAGTNAIHGTGFWYYNDRGLFDSLTNLESAGLIAQPPRIRNVYGGTIGGPIIKDRAFFFASYQGIAQRTSDQLIQSSFLAILPDELSRLKSSFPGNAAVAAIANFGAFSTNALGAAKPRTDIPIDTITIGGKQFRAAAPEFVFRTPFNEDEFSGRGDVKLSQKDNLWMRYLFQTGDSENALAQANGFTGDVRVRTQNFGANWDHQISSHAISNFTFAYSRSRIEFGGGCNGLVGCIESPFSGSSLASFSLNIDSDNSDNVTEDIGPRFDTTPSARLEEVFQFGDNILQLKGRHQILFGTDIRRLHVKDQFLQGINGVFEIDSAESLAANAPDAVFLTLGNAPNRWLETDQFYYFQDDWKLRDNLTLNLGLRYEYATQPINRLHDLTVERESDSATALWRQDIPLEARTVSKVPTDKNNFAPRLGFAYAPHFWKRIFGDDATVIRGGYAIAYDPAFYNIYGNVAQTAPTAFSSVTFNDIASPVFPVPDGAPTRDAVRLFALSTNAVARNQFDPRFFIRPPSPAGGGPPVFRRSIISSDFHSPYIHQWSFGVQRQVGRTSVIEVRYLGTHGEELFQTVNSNPFIRNLIQGFSRTVLAGVADDKSPIVKTFTFDGFPKLIPSGLVVNTCSGAEAACDGRLLRQGAFDTRQNSGESTYHSLQSHFDGRLFKQLNLGVSYTLSKAQDNVSEIFGFNESPFAQNPFDLSDGEQSNSGFDRRHALSVNWIWDVPFFKEQRGILGHALGGWQVNGIYLLTSGLRFTPSQSLGSFYVDAAPRPFNGNPNADPSSVGITDVDAVLFGFTPTKNTTQGTFSLFVPSPTGFYSLNQLLSAKKLVPVSRDDVRYIYNGPRAAEIFGTPFGDVERNSLMGPRINTLNTGFFKNTRIGERTTIQFRTEVFNLFNHPNPSYSSLGGGTRPDNFLDGTITVNNQRFSSFNRSDLINSSRRIFQFGLRLIF